MHLISCFSAEKGSTGKTQANAQYTPDFFGHKHDNEKGKMCEVILLNGIVTDILQIACKMHRLFQYCTLMAIDMTNF